MANKKDAEQQDEAVERPQGRTRGIDALSPADRQSAEMTDPFIRTSRGATRARVKTAGDVPEEARTGSVLPYRIDGIDVDSFDARTPADIQAEREKEQKANG